MTEKKKKPIILVGAILVVLVAGIVLAALFALGVFKDKIASKENEYDPRYESFYDGENDPGVTIDGKLDEDIWQGKNWFKDTYLSQPDAKMPKWNITSHISDYGIYVAAKIEDENIMNDGQHTMEANTALEFYYFIANKGEEVDGGGIDRGYVVVDMRGDVHSTTGRFKRAVIVDGELNSGNTKGATMEMFFPWEFFGKIDTNKGIPETIYMYPVYCAVFEGKETITTSISSMDSVVKAQLYLYKDYWRFNKDGYATADREGAVVGDSVTGLAKTGNWDISREKDGVVRSKNGTREHYMYFSKEYTSDFIAEATIVPVEQKAGDAKAGLYFLTGDGQYHLVTLNTPNSLLVNSVNKTKNISKYVMSTYDNKSNVYDYHEDCQGPNPNAQKKEGVQLTVVKNGGKFWYFVDGKFMTSEVKDFMDTDVIPAFYAWAADVEFKNYSCKKVNEEETKKYLNERGVYSIDAKVKGTGGKVETSQIAVAKGQKYDITITCNSGYEVSSILVNGQERIADAKRRAKGGVYTITADANNQEIEVKFQKCNGHKLSGFLKGGSKAIPGTLTITSSSNGILRYVVTANENKGYQVVMPAGSYSVKAEAEDYITSTVKVSLSKATTKDISLKPSMFASKVTVDGKQVRSNTAVWDRSQEAAGKIYGSYNRGTSLQPLYFAKTGNTAWFSSTIRYSTNFVEGGSYQSDLLGGLWVSDGAHTGWFGVRQHGIVYNGTWIEHVIGYDVLSTWNKDHQTTNVDFILIDGDFHVYVDGIYATKVSVTKVVPGAKKDAKLAMGLVMHADKMADIEFSNIKFSTNATQIRKDFAAKQAKHTIPSGTIFSQTVKVNNKTVESKPYRWDLTDIKKNTVTCNDGIGNQPLMFAKTGKNALIQMTVTRTDDFKGKTGYETQPLAGIYVTDGSKTGYFGIRASAIVTNDKWDHIIGRDIMASWSNIMSAELEVALKDNEFHIYIDGIFVKKVKVSEVLPGVKSGTTLALGLVSEASGKTASVKFSDIKYTTDAEKVTEYLDSKDPSKAIPEGTLFAGTVTVNGKKVESVVPVWDITNIKNNVVIGNNGGVKNPLMFAKTGTTALVETTVTRLDDKTAENRESQPMAGIYVSDGTNSGFLGVRAYSVVYGTTWLEKAIGYEVFVTWMSTHQTADIDFVLKNNQIQIYVDGIFAKSVKVSDVAPGIKDGATVAIGLLMDSSGKTAQMKFADVNFTTDAAEVEQYIEDAAGENAIPKDSIFAPKVQVNGKEVKSIIPIWDLTDIANNTVVGNNGGPTQPLYFRATGTAALVETTVTRLDDKSVSGRESQPLAGVYVTDGTKSGYIGVRASAIVMNGNWDHIIARDLFATWSSITKADIDVAIKNNEVYIYVDNILIKKVKLSDVVPGIANDATVAVGLLMDASGKNAQMKFSDVKYTTDAAKVGQYIEDAAGDSAVPKDSIFASRVQVNGKEVKSTIPIWDLTNIANNIVVGNNGAPTQPLYFKATGTTALVETTVTRLDDKSVSGRESQPLAGIYVTDGTKSGYIGVRASAIVMNGNWDHIIGRDLFATWSTITTADIDVAIKSNEVYIYVDDVLMKKVKLSDVVPGIANDATVAVGLLMDASGKNAQMKFSNVKYTTDATKVAAYIESMNYDPSIKNFIEYARALGQGYENGVGSNKIAVDENTTIFIGDSFFERRYFWTDFYTDDYKDANAFCAGIGSTTTDNWKHLIKEVFAVYGDKAPKNIVMHLGTNDLWADTSTADGVVSGLKEVFNILHTKYPQTKIYYFGITHRGDNTAADKINSINSTISTWSASQDYLTYIDTPSKITADMLRDDKLHPKLETYSVFVQELAKSGCVILDKNGQPLPNPSGAQLAGLFANEVTVNGKKVTSAADKWDITNMLSNSMRATSELGSNLKPIYFAQAGKTMLMTTNVSYTTLKGESMVGIYVTDGTNSGYVGIQSHGLVNRSADGTRHDWYTTNTWSPYMFAPASWGGKTSAEVSIVYKEGYFYFYVDGVYGNKMPITNTMAAPASDADLAFALVTNCGSQYDVTFSNIRYTTNATTVNNFLNPLPSTLFAGTLAVNGKMVNSAVDKWDIANIANNVLRGTSELGSNIQPMYFKSVGKTMLMKTNVAYATLKGESMVGIYVTDGTNSGYVGIQSHGLVNRSADGTRHDWYTTDTWSPYMFAPASWGGKTSAEVSIVYKEGYFYFYVDGVYGNKMPITNTMAAPASDADLAFALVTNCGSQYDVTFSNTEFTVDATEVNNFLNPPAPPAPTLFADSLTVNGKTVTSAKDKWDITKIADDTLRATKDLGTNIQPMYFKNVGKTMLMTTDVAYAALSGEAMVGVYVTDGTNKGYVGIQSHGLVNLSVSGTYVNWYTDNTWSAYMFAPAGWGGKTSAEVSIVYKEGYFYFYVDGLYGNKMAITETMAAPASDADLAFALVTNCGANYDVTFSNIEFTTDATEVNNFLNPPAPTLFADSLTVNGKTVTSAKDKWDTTKAAEDILHATKTLGSNLQPMYFKTVGKAMLMQTDVAYTTLKGESMVGIYVTDGTNKGYVGIQSHGLVNLSVSGTYVNWYTDNTWSAYMFAPAGWGGKTSAQVSIAYKEGYFYFYVDGLYGNKMAITETMAAPASDADLAFALVTNCGSDYDVTFSNIEFTVDATEVNNFLNPPVAAVFGDSLTVNGKAVTSAKDKWDTTNIAGNTLRATKDLGSNIQPMYFNTVGKTMLMTTDVTYAALSGESMVGIYVTDGTNSGYVGIQSHGIVNRSVDGTYLNWYTDNTWSPYMFAPAGWGGKTSAQVSIAYKEGYFYFFVDGVYGNKMAITNTMAAPASDADLAFALVTNCGSNYDVTFSKVSYTTDAEKVNTYLTSKNAN